MRILEWALLILLAVILLILAGFTIWAYTPLGPMPEAIAALQSDTQVQVGTSPWLTFTAGGNAAEHRLHLLPRAAAWIRAAYAPRHAPSPSRATW